MQIIKNTKNNLLYKEFDKYKHEILLDSYDAILKSNILIVKKTLLNLGENEVHNIIKYHHKITLNVLFFKDNKLFLAYHSWLYRVYYHRKTDLDFFVFLLELFQNICHKYIDKKIYIDIVEFYKYILDKHEDLKLEAKKKKVLIDNVEEAQLLSSKLLRGDKQAAYELCKKNSLTMDQFLSYYNKVISSSMKNIGYLWESGEISVAKEHLSTNTLSDVLSKIIEELDSKQINDKHIFISSAPDEHHGQGIMIASKVFEKLGYKVINLGTNIPSKDIKKAIYDFKPDYIILAATLHTSLLDIALLVADITKDKDIFIKPLKIIIAGNAFEKIINPAKLFNVDYYMDKLEDISAINE